MTSDTSLTQKNFQSREPRIHSHIDDELPPDHPLAFKIVNCQACAVMVHCESNECMQTWVETGRGTYCLPCFVNEAKAEDGLECLYDNWGLGE